MASERWQWNPERRQYRDTRTGRYLSARQVRRAHLDFLTARKVQMVTLTEDLAEGRLTLPQWERAFRQQIKLTWGAQWAFGRGGRNVMTPRDWGAVGRAVREQYRWLGGFASDLADGKLSPAQATARAQLYASASTYAFARGQAASYSGLRLPVYPADGGTECKANCKCRWEISDEPERWVARWRLGAAEHCSGCLDRAGRYARYVVEKEQAA